MFDSSARCVSHGMLIGVIGTKTGHRLKKKSSHQSASDERIDLLRDVTGQSYGAVRSVGA